MSTIAASFAHSTVFPGLRPFRSEEEHLFFGRESQVDAMVDKLAQARFLAVVGTSGSGKSSLVNCGLRPALHRGLMAAAGTSWRVAQFRPGNKPIEALTSALVEDRVLYSGYNRAVPLHEIIDTSLRVSKRGLLDVVRKARLADGTNLLVVVDQFEELFRYQTQNTSPDESQASSQEAIAFVNLLLEAKRQTDLPIYIVLTMRSDFLGNCATFTGLPEAINEGLYLVPRLTREERRRAIQGPIGVGGARIDPALLSRLINDVGDNPDQLSILQHALNRTWAHWVYEGHAEGPISFDHYEAIGTMTRALDLHAEKAYGELATDRQRKICEKVFKSLTDKGSDARGIRRPTTLDRLCLVTGATPTEIDEVIEVFRKPSRSFLMPPLPEVLGPATVIDISHESLMRVWERLRVWSNEEAECARLYSRLLETTALHEAGKAGLWRDPDLQVALDWRNNSDPREAWADFYGGGFQRAMIFLAQSEALRQTEIRDHEEQQSRKVEYEKAVALGEEQKLRIAVQHRAARRLRVLMTALAILFGAALVASVWAVKQERKAETSEHDATARQLAAMAVAGLREDPERSIVLGMHAVGATVRFGEPPIPAAVDALQLAIQSLPRNVRLMHDAPVTSITYSPDGKYVATASSDKKARIWDAANGHLLSSLASHVGAVSGLAFSSDARRLATASYDGTVIVWDTADWRAIQTIDLRSGALNAVVYAPNGAELIVAGSDGTAKILDASSGKLLRTLRGHSVAVESVAVSADGNLIATAGADGDAKVWRSNDSRSLLTLRGHSGAVNAVAFSPDGAYLATASVDNTARLWDLQRKGLQVRNFRHSGSVRSVAFSPDGKHLATGTSDNTASVWDTVKGVEIQNLKPQGAVNAIAFSPDGRSLATADGDNTAQLWDLAAGNAFLKLQHGDSINDVTFSPDGNWIATASSEEAAQIWNALDGQRLRSVGQSATPVNSVAFSKDGKYLAIANADGSATIWDAHRGVSLHEFKGHSGAINGIAYSPDSRFIATASSDNTVIVWDTITFKAALQPLHHNGVVNFVVFDRAGSRLASASSDGTAVVWDAHTGKALFSVRSKSGGILDVAFSPDGQRLITAGFDHTVTLWNALSGEQLRNLRGHGGAVLAVAASPDNQQFATASQDGTVRVWDYEGKNLQTLYSQSGAVNSVAFSPDRKRIATANTDGTVQVYLLDISELLKLARSRTNRSLTPDECERYFQKTTCPPMP